jgi:beta-galactosidase/beta-glucuronidase
MHDSGPVIPRAEHPRPQFVRPDWLCLNGAWEFRAGAERWTEITVPFCPEAPLSGVGRTAPMPEVWYRRRAQVPAAWAGREVLLHFQAVDYDATVWVDGEEVARHRGGFTPFSALLPSSVAGCEIEITVRALDDLESPQPRGKQTQRPESWGVFYTRTTGIWQTVWLEPVPEVRLLRPRITPDLAGGRLLIRQPVSDSRPGWRVRARAAGVEAAASLGGDYEALLVLQLPPGEARLWSPADPHLYEIHLELLDGSGTVADRASTYAGLRGIARDGKRLLLNGIPVFQRLVLDQGYWPDGVMTAPTDEALRKDVELGLAAGFNGARLHQKVFEERYLYHADRLGYLVWSEFPDWGGIADAAYVAQWLEAIERDASHPAIVGWCGLNETPTEIPEAMRAMWLAAKLADGSRPVLDASGWTHLVPQADLTDAHDYEQDPAKLTATYSERDDPRPFFVSEFGGALWSEAGGWGYGDAPRSESEWLERFEMLVGALLDNPALFGYCYTQLTDVYKEQNGVYTFDRRPKFDLDRIRGAQQRPAAYELGSYR